MFRWTADAADRRRAVSEPCGLVSYITEPYGASVLVIQSCVEFVYDPANIPRANGDVPLHSPSADLSIISVHKMNIESKEFGT
jgi:hypothetical protein